MPSTSAFHVRFAIGSANGPRSSIWRLWTSKKPKSDVYLAARHVAGAFKASLHESGGWQVSFISEFVNTLRSAGSWPRDSRHVDRWQRPTEISPGITLAFRIVVPASELRVNPIQIPDEKPVSWVPPPSSDHATEFDVFFTKPQVGVSGWPGKRRMATGLISQTLLSNGETLWVVYYYPQITQGMLDRIEQLRAEIPKRPPEWSRGEINIHRSTLRLIVGGREPDGSHYFMEVAADTVFS